MNEHTAPVCPRCDYSPVIGTWRGWYALASHFYYTHGGSCLCGYRPPFTCSNRHKSLAEHLRDHPDGRDHLSIYHTLDAMAKVGDS